MPTPVAPATPLAGSVSRVTNTEALAALDSLRANLPALFSALAKTINVEQILAKSGTVGQVTIGEIKVGDVVVDSVKLSGTSANLRSGNAFLEHVFFTLELKFGLHWWFDIGIYSDSGDENLGSLSFGMSVGNVSVPSLDNIQMNIPSVSVNNVAANVKPIQNLNLGAAAFSKLKVDDTTLPAAGFGLTGLALGSLNLSGLGVPEVKSKQASIDGFKPNQTVLLPSASLGGISVPATAIPDVKSGAFGLDAQASSRSIGVDFGIFGFTFYVTPIVHMQIGSMTLHDLNLSAAVNQVTVENVHLPVDVHGILLKTLKLDDVQIDNVSL